MARLSLFLLGSPRVLLDGEPVSGLASRRAKALLTYLAVESDRPHPRDALAALLWPDWPQGAARHYLRNELTALRRAIGDREADPPHLLSSRETIAFSAASDHGLLRLSQDANYYCDVSLLDALSMDRLASATIVTLQRAADAYRGEFLEGFSLDDCPAYEEWLSLRREHYRRRVLTVLHHLAQRHLDGRAYRAAERCARRCLALDPLDEAAHRELMRALALDGRRAEALQQYEVCAQTLGQELGVGPSAETATLRESIRAEALSLVAPEPVAPSPPPSRSLPLPLRQLPPPPADFIGRKEELCTLAKALQREEARLCAIRGPGGIGKTTVALELGQRIEEQYPDAQLYLEMRGTEAQPLTPAEAMAHVIHAYYPLTSLPTGEQALRATYLSVLHDQRALLLLDNVRDREQVEPLLPPASCALLITTRQHFSLPGLHTIDLQVTSLAESVELLRAIAPRLGEEEARELGHACGQLPLALRVAGSALAEREDLPVAEYLGRLRTAQDRLPPEMQAVEASLALSDALLDETLRGRWYALSIFPGTFDRAGAAAIWGIDEEPETRNAAQDAAQDALSELLRYSLVEYNRDTGRYRLHDLTRAYGHSRLADPAAEEVGWRHAAHYAQVWRQALEALSKGGGATLAHVAVVDREWENIVAGQAWAAARVDAPGGLGERAARLCCDYKGDKRQTYRFYDSAVAGRLGARVHWAWCVVGLQAARRLGDRSAEANCLSQMGELLVDSRPRTAREYQQQALDIAREIGDRRLEGWIRHSLAFTFYFFGEMDLSIAGHEQNLTIAREVADPALEAHTLRALGAAHRARGDGRRAIAYLRQSLEVVEAWGLATARLALFHGLAHACCVVGDAQQGLEYALRERAAARELGDQGAERAARFTLGMAYTALGEPERAVPHHRELIAYFRETGSHHNVAYNLHALGLAYRAMGDDRQAIAQQEEALSILCEADDRRGQAQALQEMSLAYDRLGERERAVALAEEALSLYEAIRHPRAEEVRRQLAAWRDADAA